MDTLIQPYCGDFVKAAESPLTGRRLGRAERSSGQAGRAGNMTCAQCGYDAAEGTEECPRCGTRVAAGHETASSGYNFDARRWALSDEIAGAASLVVLISLFLPWFNASYIPFASSTATSGGSESGMDAHGWLWLVFIVVLAILAYLVIAAGFQVLPFKAPLRHDQLLLAATGLNLALVFVGFLLKPSSYGIEGVSIGWSFGAFLALIAAIVAIGVLTPLGRQRLDSRSPAADQ
jgi:hypothetical protein